MINGRDKFIELLEQAIGQKNNDTPTLEEMADHLINALNGSVIIPPCKVGDTVYVVCRSYFSKNASIQEQKATSLKYINGFWYIDTDTHFDKQYGLSVFTDYNDAVEEVKGRDL